MWIWIKGTTTPTEIRDRAKEDPIFRNRLLEYISSIIFETMPPQVISEEDCPSISRAFQPLVDPQSPYFKESMAIDLYALVTTRNMHARNHMPTCFKYSKTQCRTRFPRTIISESTMDPETGLIRLK